MSGSTRCSRCGADLPAESTEAICLSCSRQLSISLSGTVTLDPAAARASATTAPAAQPLSAPDPGQSLGPVRLLEVIGKGAMGIVYRAQHTLLGREVAVKVVSCVSTNPHDKSLQRFVDEARAAAAVRHPHLVQIHHADIAVGTPFLVMDFIGGPTLKQLLKQSGPLSLSAVLAILEQITPAVDELHRNGVIHRDLKPSNVLLDRQAQAFVSDFGLAFRQAMTPPGVSPVDISGTPAYMAPEMFDGQASARSDIYALGIMCYEMLTGEVPFSGSLLEIRQQHRTAPLPAGKLAAHGVGEELADVLQRAAHKSPVFRYKTAGDFLRAFQQAAPTAAAYKGAQELEALLLRPTRSAAAPSPPAPAPAASTAPGASSEYEDLLTRLANARREQRARADVSHKPLAPPLPQPPSAAIPPPLPPPPPPKVSPPLAADVPCRKCGYNLRGLTSSAQCPECAEAVARSLDPARLIFADETWFRSVLWGHRLIVLSVPFLTFCGLVAELISSLATQSEVRAAIRSASIRGIIVAVAALIASGIFLCTRRVIPRSRSRGLSRWQLAVRLAMIAAVAGPITLAWIGTAKTADSHAWGLAISIPANIMAILLLGYLDRLARACDRPGSRLVRIAALAMLWTMLAMSLVLSVLLLTHAASLAYRIDNLQRLLMPLGIVLGLGAVWASYRTCLQADARRVSYDALFPPEASPRPAQSPGHHA